MRKVLETLKKANLQIKPKKLFFYVTEINYLKFIIFKNDIKMNLKKIRAI